MDVTALVSGLKKQDQKAFNIFVGEYSPLMLKVLSSMLKIGHEKNYIEDAYNESLMCIWKNIDSFEEKASFKTWVIAITKYRALDFKRKLKKTNNTLEIDESIISTSEDVENKYILSKSKEDLLAILAPLKNIDKDIFMMHYYYGYNAKIISTNLKISEDNIFKRLSRGRKKLKDHYSSLHNLQEII